jgi:signal peptidase I
MPLQSPIAQTHVWYGPDAPYRDPPISSTKSRASPPVKQTTTKPNQPATDETIKETFESIVIAFILAFVFRAYVVEAFVIPTGSMAPTLLGAHYSVECEQCGYQFKINHSADHNEKRDRQGNLVQPARWTGGAVCPMCRFNIDMATQAKSLPGDRILVHKYIYSISEPRRWDVVVFKAPHIPDTNFIKRLVGLPNESIRLLDGNVYTQAEGQTLWNIARKSDKPKVQRAVWQPLYHSQYIPRDGGGLKGPGERNPGNRWSTPWVAESGNWDIDGRRSYLYKGGETGKINFDFYRGTHFSVPGIYAYNQYDRNSFNDGIEDIRLALAIQPQAGSSPTTVKLSTQTRLTGETQTVTATITTQGSITLSAIDPATGQTTELMSRKLPALHTDRATPIEFWAVDQELSIWINGKRMLRYLFADNLTYDQLVNRPPPPRLPRVSIEMTGGPATLHRVELDRDLYYASSNGRAARGGLVRDAQGRVLTNNVLPMRLLDNEFFCIGDNNPLSDDGRFWSPGSTVNNSAAVSPSALWVRQKYFGKAMGDNSRDGIVPGKLMMGRAFFVYFPAPYAWKSTGFNAIPNFDDMRFIH